MYFIDNPPFHRQKESKDLGMIITEDLKFHKHVDKVCGITIKEINRIRRNFVPRSPKYLSTMSKLYARPHLGYCVQVWNPHHAGDMCQIEKSQNEITKLLKHRRLLSPNERNDILEIKCHDERLRCDSIYMLKI